MLLRFLIKFTLTVKTKNVVHCFSVLIAFFHFYVPMLFEYIPFQHHRKSFLYVVANSTRAYLDFTPPYPLLFPTHLPTNFQRIHWGKPVRGGRGARSEKFMWISLSPERYIPHADTTPSYQQWWGTWNTHFQRHRTPSLPPWSILTKGSQSPPLTKTHSIPTLTFLAQCYFPSW